MLTLPIFPVSARIVVAVVESFGLFTGKKKLRLSTERDVDITYLPGKCKYCPAVKKHAGGMF